MYKKSYHWPRLLLSLCETAQLYVLVTTKHDGDVETGGVLLKGPVVHLYCRDGNCPDGETSDGKQKDDTDNFA